ncbi:DUF2520 domain-containing protein [Paraburkholderia sp. Tr-20389]|uniref:Rossmann-like and DUF2520 domain-containing protein n=1 Tax=Paraburkholderia sp. Tr-20389 TaxID=2703903 RepID=UPI00197E1342|nr:DUF2520 domain-containing protein [Paraburkholderia sp. Tr-20389]MBN3754361.1 DUF2520 domain-containing protein [Paraburkholderia sp. Tr-20389]
MEKAISVSTSDMSEEKISPRDALSSLKIGFVGCGRLATALGIALSKIGIRVAAVSSRRSESANKLARTLPGCVAMDAQAVVDVCDLVFITTKDEAIEETVAALKWRTGISVVHCSGATEVAVLDKASRDGATVGGFHPLQSFTDPVAAAHSLLGCTITVEADGWLGEVLNTLVSRLGCRVNRLPAGVRGRYHAAAGYPSQFINVLLREAAEIWASWGGQREDALLAFLPMVRGTLASIEARGLADGMPGPASRGDAKTVAAHVSALGSLHPDVLSFYRMLCSRSVDLAGERKYGLPKDVEERIRMVLTRVDPND